MAIKNKPAAGRVIISADTIIDYPLTADPDVQALGDEVVDGIRSGAIHVEGGELRPLGLRLPVTTSTVSVRPLTIDERDAAEEEAGPQEHLGLMLAGYIEQQVQATGSAGERAAVVERGRQFDALQPDEREAYNRLVARHGRRLAAYARRGIEAVCMGEVTPEGTRVVHYGQAEAWQAVMGVDDKPTRNRIIAEVGAHVERLTGLTEEGKG